MRIMRTSCRFAMAVHVLAVLAYKDGDRVTSRLGRSPARINLGDVYRAVEEHECFVMTRRKPDHACPVGQCIRGALETVFTSAEEAIIHELSRTTLAHILDRIRAACGVLPKRAR